MSLLEKEKLPIPKLKTDFDFLENWENYWENLLSVNKKNQRIPGTNITETDDTYYMQLGVPGMKKEDFYIRVEDNEIIIGAERENTKKDKKKHYKMQEYNFQSFERSFTVPNEADLDKIEAKYDNGELQITIPKKTDLSQKVRKNIRIN